MTGGPYLRAAACQIRTFPSPQESAEKVTDWLGVAAADGVEVVVFPEATLCGYASGAEYWEQVSPGSFLEAEERVAKAAQSLRIAVVLGSVHWEEGRRHNSLLLIDRDGETRGRYAKTHLAEPWSDPGRRLVVTELAGVKSCFIICHDVRYPELVRLPVLGGAQVCYYASNESGLLSEHKLSAYQVMPCARAAENTIYLVMANAPADPENLRSPSQSHGNSKIIEPDGNVLVEAGFFEERLVAWTLDLSKATREIALRSVNDSTVLAAWMKEGASLVEDLTDRG